ncbi:MAG TPA: trypsin-like peptidase domain-containing protein [Anaerolineales bacterium]
MDRRRFSITAIIGCGLLLLLIVIAIPALLFISFRDLDFGGEAVIPRTGEQVEPPTQQAVPTFTPAPAAETALTEQTSSGLGVGNGVLTTLYEEVNPGVVSIAVNVEQGGRTGQGAGSGFLIDEQGHIVTNNHVIAGARSVTVTFFDGSQVGAEIVGADPDSDLAVIIVDQLPDNVRPLPLGDSDVVLVGEWVVAIGNPFMLSNSMTVGIVSAVGRTIPTEVTPFSIPQVIQTDAAINPGNSGGPLLNLRGEVIGVNESIATSGGVRANAGVGFAVPVNIVRRVVPVLIEQGEFTWPWLGVEGGNVGMLISQANNLDVQHGAYIDNVVDGGPADEAGLRGTTGTTQIDQTAVPVGGDVVVEADGQQINNFDDLLNVIAFHNPGDQLDLTIIREGERQQVTVTLAPRPSGFGP